MPASTEYPVFCQIFGQRGIDPSLKCDRFLKRLVLGNDPSGKALLPVAITTGWWPWGGSSLWVQGSAPCCWKGGPWVVVTQCKELTGLQWGCAPSLRGGALPVVFPHTPVATVPAHGLVIALKRSLWTLKHFRVEKHEAVRPRVLFFLPSLLTRTVRPCQEMLMLYPSAPPFGLPHQLSVHGAGAAGEEMASSRVSFSLGFDAGPSWHVLFWRDFRRPLSPP